MKVTPSAPSCPLTQNCRPVFNSMRRIRKPVVLNYSTLLPKCEAVARCLHAWFAGSTVALHQPQDSIVPKSTMRERTDGRRYCDLLKSGRSLVFDTPRLKGSSMLARAAKPQQEIGMGEQDAVGHSTNLVGLPTELLASCAFNDHPVRLHISGVREMN